MQVVLKVVGGKNDGREINISVPEFVIGRGETAHLRPSSDLISRRHCVIRIGNGQVIVEDMGSRNGTFINGEQLQEPHKVKSGDLLRVGRLQFNILLDPAKAGAKRPRVNSVAEAAARTADGKKSKAASIEDSITDWLMDADEEDEQRQAIRRTETVQFSLDDTTALGAPPPKPETDAKQSDSSSHADSTEMSTDETQSDVSESGSLGSKLSKKKKYGKLPKQPKFSHDDSKTAAGEVLKRFFNRR